MDKQLAVYILASKRNGTLYTGVTSDLRKRIWEHKNDLVEGFTKKYQVHLLVWYEIHETMESAILREKRIKQWKRLWKLRMIEGYNPTWQDLYHSIIWLDSGLRRNDEKKKDSYEELKVRKSRMNLYCSNMWQYRKL